MDAFNYLTVMVSTVVGLGLTQLLAGIGNFVQIRRRVRFYWLHTCWVVLLIALHLHMWWSLWVLRQVTDWTYGTFAYVLIGPAMKEKLARLPRTTFFRPMRSASVPAIAAPSSMPNRVKAAARPTRDGSSAHSACLSSAGAITP